MLCDLELSKPNHGRTPFLLELLEGIQPSVSTVTIEVTSPLRSWAWQFGTQLSDFVKERHRSKRSVPSLHVATLVGVVKEGPGDVDIF